MTPRAWKRLFARSVLWAGIVLGVVFVAVLGSATWTIYLKNADAERARADAAADLSNLENRQQVLSRDLSALDTPRGVDAAIRKTYPLAKKGEEVIVLTDTATSASKQAPETPWSWFSAWFSW